MRISQNTSPLLIDNCALYCAENLRKSGKQDVTGQSFDLRQQRYNKKANFTSN